MNKYLEEFSIEDYTNFDKYYELLVETNKVMNLTGITEYEEVYIKHFYDSLLLTKCNNNLDNIVDVGSGAGFPGMPLKIVMPENEYVLADIVLNHLITVDPKIAEKYKNGEIEEGKMTLRAKIDLASGNFNMRDPKMHYWYYSEIAKQLSELSDTAVYKEYLFLIDSIFSKYLEG